jgi:hypothetical protein
MLRGIGITQDFFDEKMLGRRWTGTLAQRNDAGPDDRKSQQEKEKQCPREQGIHRRGRCLQCPVPDAFGCLRPQWLPVRQVGCYRLQWSRKAAQKRVHDFQGSLRWSESSRSRIGIMCECTKPFRSKNRCDSLLTRSVSRVMRLKSFLAANSFTYRTSIDP